MKSLFTLMHVTILNFLTVLFVLNLIKGMRIRASYLWESYKASELSGLDCILESF